MIDDPKPVCLLKGFGDSSLRAVSHRPQEREARSQLLQQAPTAVARPVVDDDHLVPRRLPRDHRLAQLEEEREVLRLVLRRHEHADINRTRL